MPARPPQTLATAFARPGNGFDLLRLAAALLVMASHAYILTGHPGDEPIGRLTRHAIDGGALAVAAFFILSGFLIARSAQRHPNPVYLRARALRLYPALAGAALVQILLLGAAASTLGPLAYWATPETWAALAATLAFTPHANLPGLFATNPIPEFNGSLWTLRVEALCYLALLLITRTGWLRPARILLPLALLYALLATILTARAGHAPAVFASLRTVALTDCTLSFLMGAAAWAYADRIPLDGRLAALATILLTCAIPTPAAPVALHLLLPYLVLWLGLAIRTPALPDDISYGTYLYAFPIQQTAIALGLATTPLQAVLVALPPTLLLAIASRRWVERPALRWRFR